MEETETRLAALRDGLAAKSIDALLIHQAENRRYVTGFTGSAGLPIVSAGEPRLLVDSRYVERARREAPAYRVSLVEGRMVDAAAAALAELGAGRVGFESETVTVAEMDRLRAAVPDAEWVPTSGLVEKQRAVKSAAELARIAAAVELTDAAMEFAYGEARAGMTERQLAWRLEVFLRERGAESLAFETIVGSGANGALPHHSTGDDLLQAGRPIVIDIGAKLGGYCGDLTRTFSLGTVKEDRYQEVYDVVAAASARAIEGLRPGMTGREADELARQVIADAGYGDAFGHGLGHGVGLNVHELPRLSPLAEDDPLAAGMVVTIEPGIYLPGHFGVRIEDLVVVRDDGVEVLSRARKPPIVDAR